MTRPTRATLDFSALAHNLAIVRRHAPQARIMAVIKANAYGHGMMDAARALKAADGFAVLNQDEGIGLRKAGFQQEILLLEGFFSSAEIPLLVQHRLTPVIHTQWQVDALLQAPSPISAWLKINTGMNRLGFQPSEVQAALHTLQQSVTSVTLMTHFACADEKNGIAQQLALFDSLTHGLLLPRSLSNSAAILNYPDTHGDWVRPGIMLYGASPTSHQSASELGLRPAMTLASEIIATHDIAAGATVGYGANFRASKPMRIGTVACGYADGYPRHATSGTPVLVNGQRTTLIGRVSMDMLTVDLTPVPDAEIGSPVILWGAGLPVEEVATAAGTISYELLCAVTQRVPRIFI